MKKLLFLTPEFSEKTGGLKYNKRFVEILKENKDLEITILSDKDFGCENGMRWYSAGKYYKNIDKTFAKYDIVLIDAGKYMQLLPYISKIKKLKQNVEFIAIHHHYVYHTISKLKFIHKFAELKFLKAMDEIVYASDYTYNLGKEYLNEKVKHTLIRVPVEIDQKPKKSWKGKILSTIGGKGYGKRKGHKELVESLNIVKDNIKGFKLDIIGSFDKNEESFIEVNSLLTKYGIKESVNYCGRVPEEEKYDILRNSKFYVFPSQYEGYGLSVLEAMSVGLPVIAFNNSAMPTIIKHGKNGFLCDSVEQFAEAIEKLYNDDKLCETIGKKAIEYVKTCQTSLMFKNQVADFGKNLAKE